MARKSNTFLMLLCLLVASLLLITGGCDKGKGEERSIERGLSDGYKQRKRMRRPNPLCRKILPPPPHPILLRRQILSPPPNPTRLLPLPPTPPLTPAERAKKEAETERLEHFINLDDCIHGNWRSSSDYGIREKELFNEDGEKIGLVLHHNVCR